MPQQIEARTITIGPTKTATVEVRQLSRYAFRANVKMEWGYGMPSVLVVEIHDPEDESRGDLYLPHDSAGRFPTY